MTSIFFSLVAFRSVARLLLVGLCSLALGYAASAQGTLPNIDFTAGNFNNWKCYVGYSWKGILATGASFRDSSLVSPIGGGAPAVGPHPLSRHAIYYGGRY